jgi:hypothetical protein
MFKKLTAAQRDAYDALRALGKMNVTPRDARPLKALKRRGLIRYARENGARVAILRQSGPAKRAVQRERRAARQTVSTAPARLAGNSLKG